MTLDELRALVQPICDFAEVDVDAVASIVVTPTELYVEWWQYGVRNTKSIGVQLPSKETNA